LRIALLLALIWTPCVAGKDLPGPDELVRRLKEAYAPRCCFQAKFDQLIVNVAMDMKDHFEGALYVRKPGLIALDVAAPEKQKLVISGRSYTVHFPDEGNTVRGEIPPELNLEHFFGFFADVSRLEEKFEISVPSRAVDEDERLLFLQLTDKQKKAGSYSILLGVDSGSYIIRRAMIFDALGNYNRFDLSDVKFVDSIPDEPFRTDYDEGKSEKPVPLIPRKSGD
jgi:outer membrane lipoprotein-sorting protein